jgi:hypothetical protein
MRGKAFNRTFQDCQGQIIKASFGKNHHLTHTGDCWMAANIASRIGSIKGRGGVTPHILTSNTLAPVASSSLSFTEKISVLGTET